MWFVVLHQKNLEHTYDIFFLKSLFGHKYRTVYERTYLINVRRVYTRVGDHHHLVYVSTMSFTESSYR